MKITLIALGVLVVAFLVIRFRFRTEASAILMEPGRIEQLTWTPATHGSSVGISTKDGSAIVSNVDTPEQFAVVISCPHGKFMLDPRGDNASGVFHAFKVGDSITIHYRELYRIYRDGSRELHKLDFLRAEHRRVER